jgi:hypothetical protein
MWKGWGRKEVRKLYPWVRSSTNKLYVPFRCDFIEGLVAVCHYLHFI